MKRKDYSIYSDQNVLQSVQAINQAAADANNANLAARNAKNALNGGEISPEMAARFDQNKYLNGLFKMENMVSMPCGGATIRPGLNQIYYDIAASGLTAPYAVKLIPFIFSANQSRMLFLIAGTNITRVMVFSSTGQYLHMFGLSQVNSYTLSGLTYCQSADVIYCACPTHRPFKIMRYSDTDWRVADINFGPDISPPGCGVIPEGEGSGSVRTYEYVATAISDITGTESTTSPVQTVTVYQLSSTFHLVISVGYMPNAAEYRIYKKSAGVFGFIGRIENRVGVELKLVDDNIQPDTSDTPPNYKILFDTPGNYPSVVFLHQQRLGYASTDNKPMTIWMSQSGAYESMQASVPPQDDDAIEVTLAASQCNRILWAASDREGLTVGTEGGEWMLTASEGNAITPTNLNFIPQTMHGSEPGVLGIKCNTGIVFCQRGGRAVRELAYTFQSDSYIATDLSILSRHIFKNDKIRSWAWQPEPYGIIWMAMNSGILVGLTWMKEHEICAWHRHIINARVLEVSTVPDGDGNWRLFAIVQNEEGKLCAALLGTFGSTDLADHAFGTYKGSLIPCLPEPGQELFTSVKKLDAIKFRVINSSPFKCRALGGAKNGEWLNVPKNTSLTAGDTPQDWACHLAAGSRDNVGFEIESIEGKPLTILGLEFAYEMSTMLGNQR